MAGRFSKRAYPAVDACWKLKTKPGDKDIGPAAVGYDTKLLILMIVFFGLAAFSAH
jgi:hypothetical protein